MDAHDTLFTPLTTAGVTLTLSADGAGLLATPAPAVTPGIAAYITARRPALLAALMRAHNDTLMAAAVHDVVQDRDRCSCGTRGTVRLHDGTWRCDACYGVLCNAAWPPVDPTHATALCRALAIDPAALAEVSA